MRQKLIFLVLMVIVLSTTGCASIVRGGGKQKVQINTNPDSATVKIYDMNDQLVHTNQTPCEVVLKNGRGYMKGMDYRLVIEKDGYQTREIQLTSRVAGWYAFGNLGIGGLIGYLIVDPLTGAMWVVEPNIINETLVTKEQVSLNDMELKIVLLKDVPIEIQKNMKLISQ